LYYLNPIKQTTFASLNTKKRNFMKVKRLLHLIILLAGATVVQAQTPWAYAKQATDAWPGATAKAAIVTGDGIVTAGEMGLLDIMEGELYMVKTDMAGNVLWEQSHDKPGDMEVVNSISALPADGGYVVASILYSEFRPWFVKTDLTGNLIWESSAWSDLLPENSVSRAFAYSLPSGDIACVVADDISRNLIIYTVNNTDGSLISTTSHNYETLTGVSLFSASTSDIVDLEDGGFIFATRFGAPDSFFCNLTKIDADLNFAGETAMGSPTDNFTPALINKNSDASVVVTGIKNIGFLGDNYQGTLAHFNSDLGFIGFTNASGDLLHSTLGEITQTSSGAYKLIRYNFNGDFFDMAVGDYVEVVSLDATFNEIGNDIYNYAPYNTLEFISATGDNQYVTGGMAWTIGDPNYYLVIGSGSESEIPACVFNCVWPGDADNSGATDMDDILALGLGYGSTGSMRDDMSIDWYAHNALDWDTELPSGVNHKYTDCNGDGIINDDDTLAISTNFSLEHAVYYLKTTEGEIPLSFAPVGPLVVGFNSIPIVLGDAANMLDAIYGLRFTAFAEGIDIDAASVKIQFNDSFLGLSDELLSLSKTITDVPAASGGVVKTNQINSSGFGIIGTLNFVVIDNIAGKTEGSPVNLRFENVKAIDVNENEISLLAGELSLESPNVIVTQQNESIQVYPNPVTNNECYLITDEQVETIQLFNIYGALVYSSNNISTPKISLPELPSGQYLLQVQTNNGPISRQISVLSH
jgi:hypothetical protein